MLRVVTWGQLDGETDIVKLTDEFLYNFCYKTAQIVLSFVKIYNIN
jgi:hypothetical protein